MRKVFWGVILAGAVLVAGPLASAKDWHENISFDAALKKAAAEKKFVFIEFFATWCYPCHVLEASTFKDPKVVEWLGKHTVPLKIDAEKELALASRYRVDSYPTLVFIKPDGKEFDRLLGVVTAEQLLEAGEGILQGKDSIGRAKDKLEKGDKTDPMLHVQMASAYAAKGKYAEALEEYLWCLDEGFPKRPEYSGFRIYVLMDVMMLGQTYPQAVAELAKRRATATKRVFDESPTPDDVFTFAAMNEVFGEPHANVEAYEKLRTNEKLSTEAKAALLRTVMPKLLEDKRYKDIAADVDIMAAVNQEFEAASGAPRDNPEVQMMLLSIVTGYYQVLVGLERTEDAAKVAQRAIEFADVPQTYNALAWHGYLSGKPTAADAALARKGYELSKGEDAAIVDTLARILYARGEKAEAIKVVNEGLKKTQVPEARAMLERALEEFK